MATPEYHQLLKMGFSPRFLKTASGTRNAFKKIYVTGHPSPYRCTQCGDYYVRTDEIDWDVYDEEGGEVNTEPSLAQKAGFCSTHCVRELEQEKGAENAAWAAMVALRPDFYESRQWREVRYQAILKYGRTCMCCRAEYSDTGGPDPHVSNIEIITSFLCKWRLPKFAK